MYGDKIFVVEDRMSPRYSNRADIWFATREEARHFGVRKLEMVIVS
jgi:3D (Asp-Asp-Asp) domain-containing protein